MQLSWGQALKILYCWLLPALSLWALFCLWLSVWASTKLPVSLLVFEVADLFYLGIVLLLILGAARALGWCAIPPPGLKSSPVVGILPPMFLVLGVASLWRCLPSWRGGSLPAADQLSEYLVLFSVFAFLALFSWLLLDSARHRPQGKAADGAGRAMRRAVLAQVLLLCFLGLLGMGAVYGGEMRTGLVVHGFMLATFALVGLTRSLYPAALPLHSRWYPYWVSLIFLLFPVPYLLQAVAVLGAADATWLPAVQVAIAIAAIAPLVAIFGGAVLCTRPTSLPSPAVSTL